MTTPEQYYAVLDSTGEAVSFGTEVADEETLAEKGLTAVPVDGPPDGRPWDKATKSFGARPVDPMVARRTKQKTALELARKPGATTNQKLDALLELLDPGNL